MLVSHESPYRSMTKFTIYSCHEQNLRGSDPTHFNAL